MASEADFLLAFGMAALARTPVLREASPVGHFPPLWDVHRRDPQRPLHVDSCRPRHSPKLRERGNFDPELPFEIGPLNGWEVRENGLRLTASGAPGIRRSSNELALFKLGAPSLTVSPAMNAARSFAGFLTTEFVGSTYN
jgi:hypothetical protein